MISSSGESFNILTGRPIEKVDMEQLFFELSDTGYNLRGHIGMSTQKANSQQMPSGLQKVFL